MVSAVTLLKKCLSVNDSVIDNFKFFEDEYGVTYLHVYLHPLKSHSNRCPVCGKRCPIYDRSLVYHKWRCLNLGGIIVKNHESDPSISCEVDPSFVPKNQDHLEVIFNNLFPSITKQLLKNVM